MVNFKSVFYSLAVLSLIVVNASAQERAKPAKAIKDAAPCNEFAQPARQIIGQVVGVEQCHILSEETVFNINGHKFRRLEVGLSGGVEGWASREKGSRAIYFT